ncbi:MAG: tryptophan 7-halogenase [Vampirovibrio sp.]|nr:tryptophan 7-halogenase [Vampirovibrio sp.]
MKRKLAVVGVGSAGLLSLIHFCTWLDDSWEIYSIHNPAKPILGIGESTNGGFVGLLERGTHFFLGNESDLDALDATLKFGSKFEGWRDNSWVNPLLDGNTAIHFNNFHFKDFVYERLEKLWPKQFRVIEGDVTNVSNRPDNVVVTIDGAEHTFDFLIDCMGFPTSYENYTMSDCTPVNRCQIHNVTDFQYEPYTDHIATKHGWMFGVPLKSRKTYGYMYNDSITSKEEVGEDMKQILGVDSLEDKEFVFKCYYTNNLVEGRVCKNGNKALFFEPLVANSIFVYIYAARLFYDYMMAGVCAEKTNAAFVKAVQEMEDVISYYYQGGSNHDSKFWKEATKKTKKRLDKRKEFKDMMAAYKTLKSKGVLHTAPAYGFSPITWEIVDEQMGYGYIS